VGTKSAAPLSLNDPVDGKRKLFFVLSDLSIRIEGEFRLKLHFIDMTTHEIFDLVSDVVKVVTPQIYDGVEEASLLTKSFSLQGVKTAGRRYQKRLR
jgi:hypothetical protein